MNRRQPPVIATGIVTVALTLAACGSATPESEPSSTEVVVQEYSSVTELRDAAVAAGYECPSWTQSNHVTAAAQSGSCSDVDVFSTYLSEAAVQDNVEGLKSFGEIHLLVGPNWIINIEQPALDMLAAGLGGTVVEYAG